MKNYQTYKLQELIIKEKLRPKLFYNSSSQHNVDALRNGKTVCQPFEYRQDLIKLCQNSKLDELPEFLSKVKEQRAKIIIKQQIIRFKNLMKRDLEMTSFLTRQNKG